MRKFLITAIFFLSLAFHANAQDAMILEDMENLTRGILPNGLSYYLVDNGASRGFCDYYLLQRVGTVNEDSCSRYYTELIPRLVISNTYNFKHREARRFLDRLGISAAEDFKVNVNHHRTLYEIRNVNTSDPCLQDSVLLLLSNFAYRSPFQKTELEEEYRLLVNRHLSDQHSKLPSEPSPDALNSFYAENYGSDNQAIVIVGDIDPQILEIKLKTLFQTVPKRHVQIVLKEDTIKDEDEMHLDLAISPERENSYLCFSFLSRLLPVRYRLSAVPYVVDYMNFVMTEMLEKRLLLQALIQDVPLQSLQVEYGPFQDFTDREELKIEMECAPNDAASVFTFCARELERIRLYGFTEAELKNISETFVEDIHTRNDKFIPNRLYAQKCFDHYLYSYSLSSLAEHVDYLIKAKSKISVYDLNTYVRSYIKTSLNTSAVYRYPESDGHPMTAYKMESILADTQIDYSIGEFEVRPEYIINFNDSITPPVSEQTVEFHDSLSNITYWTLPNGGRVIFKQMDTYSGKIDMKAVSKKNIYPISAEYPDAGEQIKEMMKHYILNGYSSDIVEREKEDRGIALNWNFSKSNTTLSGHTRSRQLQSFFKLINWNFTALEIQSENDEIASFVSRLMESPSDYTFIFVGNVCAETIRRYVEEYLVPIPACYHSSDLFRQSDLENISKTRSSSFMVREMKKPYVSCAYKLETFMPFTLKSFILKQMNHYLFEMDLREYMEERGKQIKVSSEFVKYPMETAIFTFQFDADVYDSREIDQLSSHLSNLAWYGISQEKLDVLLSIIQNRFEYNIVNSNFFWIELLSMRALYGKDYINNYTQVLQSITVDDFNESLRKIVYSSTRYTEIVKGVEKINKK